MSDRTNRRIFEFEIRRCSLKPSRYRWTIKSADGLFIEYATESYAASRAAITAGEARAVTLNEQCARGYGL
ncbi:hypothetical protein [Methylobacterium haplocladii]|uniref:hypothetical protein n=1 Tax=Methylobacterium haplocladii TaxID=1176176 RepID=UPI001EE0918F|nr:hypothetical protein [Methylobacterium haplocladii]